MTERRARPVPPRPAAGGCSAEVRPLRLRALPAVLLLATLPYAPAARADIILLTNGKTLEGSVEDLGNGKVRVQMAYGSLSLPRERIAAVESAKTLEETIREAIARLGPGDAEGRYRLAQQAAAGESHTFSRRLLEQVIAIDPDHEAARRELGYVPYGDSWVTESQLHALRGEVHFRGEWIAPQARDQILLAEAESRAAAAAARQVQAEAAAEARLAARREAEERQTASYVASPPCALGLSSIAYSGGFGYGGFGFAGPAYQLLEPFQPGRIHVPNQAYRYSFHQSVRSRPGRSHSNYVGYRKDPPPARR